MKVTIDDVAARAKLNKGSVSRILNGKGEGYSAQTRQRVLDTASELGYQPNALARAFWTGKTHSIALWMYPEIEFSPYFAYCQFCAQQLVDKAGYKLITETFSPAVFEKSQGAYWPVDGIIACQLSVNAYHHLHSVVQERSPIVALQQSHFRDLKEYPHTDYVDVDLYAGGQQAVEHLLGAGCGRIAFVVPPYMLKGTPAFDPRSRAYFDLMSDAGKVAECVTVEHDSRTCGYEGLKDYILRHGCPDGLFCANDELAIGCYLALHELGIHVPEDVLLVGFDGLENARLFPCPITSVVVPIQEMCALGWDLLSQRMSNPEAPTRKHMLTPRLDIRASSKR